MSQSKYKLANHVGWLVGGKWESKLKALLTTISITFTPSIPIPCSSRNRKTEIEINPQAINHSNTNVMALNFYFLLYFAKIVTR